MAAKRKMTKKKKRILLIVLLVVIALVAGAFYYLKQSYPASDQAKAILTESHDDYRVENIEGQRIAFIPENPVAGIIFYPGAKVEYEAYAPLLECFAKNGVLCVMVHMPYNLAIFDVSAADGIKEDYPQVEAWYMAGHSLGGAMASKYLGKGSHSEEYEGLILLGAYSCVDLSDTNLKVICIKGSNDGVLKQDKYEKNKKYLPKDFCEFVIEGGNHAFYGDYGEQKGDGTALISREEQIETTADAIVNFLGH